MFVDTYSVYVVEILQVSSVFFQLQRKKHTHKIKDPHKVDDELWPLVCCMIRGNAQSKKMGTKLGLDHPIYILMRQKFPLFSPCVKLMS